MTVFGEKSYIIYDIDVAKRIIRFMDVNYRGEFTKSLGAEGLLGKNGPIVLTNDPFRNKIDPIANSLGEVSRYRPSYHENAAKEFEKLFMRNGYQREFEVDMEPVAVEATARIIFETMFGTKGQSLPEKDIHRMMNLMRRYLNILQTSLLSGSVQTKILRQIGLIQEQPVGELPQANDVAGEFDWVRKNYIVPALVKTLDQHIDYLNGVTDKAPDPNLISNVLGVRGASIITKFKPSEYQFTLIQEITNALRMNNLQLAEERLRKLKLDFKTTLLGKMDDAFSKKNVAAVIETLNNLRPLFKDYARTYIKDIGQQLRKDLGVAQTLFSEMMKLYQDRNNLMDKMNVALKKKIWLQ